MYEHIQNYMQYGALLQEYTSIDTNNDGIKEKTYTTIDTVYYFGPRDVHHREFSHLASIADVSRNIWKMYIAGMSVSFDKKNVIMINTTRYEIIKVYPVHDPYGNIHHYKLYITEWKT